MNLPKQTISRVKNAMANKEQNADNFNIDLFGEDDVTKNESKMEAKIETNIQSDQKGYYSAKYDEEED